MLMVLNNVMVVALQVPLARAGHDLRDRGLLLPLSAAFALGGATTALTAISGTALATVCLTASAVLFTLAEMFHATVSWELSVALAPRRPKAPTSASTASRSRPSAASGHWPSRGHCHRPHGLGGLRRHHRPDLRLPAPSGAHTPRPTGIVSAAGYGE